VAIDPVIIIGGGRVGRACGHALMARHIDYRIIERMPERIKTPEKCILGNASDLKILEKAGIYKTPAVIITPRDDDTNVYLSIYCRRLRPDVQIISRATFESNVSTLHRAGADFVMSYSSMGANTIFNLLKRGDVLLLAEGLVLFEIDIPKLIAKKTIAESAIREKTGCSVVSVHANGEMDINPSPDTAFPEQGKIILIGSMESENKFLELFGTS
jgi:voltage-gated potassium channel